MVNLGIESQYEAYVDKVTRNTPGCYTDKQLADMSYRERTGIDLDAFAATDAFSMAHKRGSITLAAIMRIARLTRAQRDVLRLIITARRKGVKLTQAVIAQKLEMQQPNVSRMVSVIESRIRPIINSLDTPYHNDLEWLFKWEIAWKNRQIYRRRITRRKARGGEAKIAMKKKSLP
jgi:hypothetical protein